MSGNVFHSLSRLAEPIGGDFAHADSKTQADLFNGFAAMFNRSMPSGLDRERQLCYIASDFTPAAKLLVRALAEFCE